jgi:hypothetical protein
LPWLSFLELHHYTLATRVGVDVPMALVGAFFPIDGDNVIGYRGGAMPADRFSEMVADEVASLK